MGSGTGAPREEKRISIEIPADLEATYANFAVITHTSSEIIVDFCRLLPNSPKTRVYARVLMTPQNAKSLQQALATNLAKYEAQFGEIKTLDDKGFSEERVLGFRHS
ncbi:MAG: DUF3467 domain-containing protein [Anaerolineae bacterium]|nr:DUF3467 domain-containing protein [Anaerolineae bacterium]